MLSFKQFKHVIYEDDKTTASKFVSSGVDAGKFLSIPDNNWNIIIPTDMTASSFHGSGTNWSDQERFEKDFYDNNAILVYLINKETPKEKYAMALHKSYREFFNSKYEDVSKQQLSKKTSLDIDKLIKQVFRLNPEIEKQRETSKKTDLRSILKNLKYPDKQIEQTIIDSGNAKYAYDYAHVVLKEPWPAGEAAIAKDAIYAYKYAFNVLKKSPFPAGEAAIAKDHYYAYSYALDILKGPFPAGEAAIAKDPFSARDYASKVLKGPFILNGITIAK